MAPKEFKTEMKNLKEWLAGKIISITLIKKEGSGKYTYSTLNGFGNAILKFESMGASFGFLKVGNTYIEKGNKNFDEFMKNVSSGVWTNVEFIATTVK